MTIRLLLADDHRMLRESLRRTIEEHDVSVVGEAADGQRAVELAVELRPDVVLMDVTMPVLDGIEAARLVTERAVGTRVVMLTMHGDTDVLSAAMRAGAVGYLVKDCSTEELIRAIRLAADENTALSSELAGSMLAEARRRDGPTPGRPGAPADHVVSPREEEVLQLIADGLTVPEVAAQLFISAKTVKNHLASIYDKLDSRDRTQAVLRAVRMGIIRLT
ncbi:MAG: response regulator [Acidimicrobiales bacterium]